MRAVDTTIMRRLHQEWRELSASRQLRAQMIRWAAIDPALAIDDPDALVAAAAAPNDGSRSCPVLDALAVRVVDDPLALRVVIQAMLPRWCALISRFSRGRDLEEVASLVVAVGTEMILACPPGTAETPTDMRLWSNTRRKVLRVLQAERRRPEQPTDHDELERHSLPAPDSWGQRELDELLSWLADRGQLDVGTARLVLLTRVAGVSLRELAAQTGVAVDALRQRRRRAERQLSAAV